MIDILMLCFANLFAFGFGCIACDLISQEIKMYRLNKKIRACRDSELDATTEKIKEVM